MTRDPNRQRQTSATNAEAPPNLLMDRTDPSANSNVRISLPLLLQDDSERCDACIERMVGLISGRPGISEVHVVDGNGTGPVLCLHYDPGAISIERVERLARTTGGEVSSRFGHAVLRLRSIDGEDAGRRIENGLLAVDGVVAASANLAAQKVGVEFDRTRTSEDQLAAALRQMGYGLGVTAATSAAKAGQHVGCAHDHAHETDSWYGRNKELVWSLIAGSLLLIGWIGERFFDLPRPAALAVFIGAYLFGGYDLTRHALTNVRQGRFTFDIDLLMLVAAVGAATLGAWAEGAFLLFLFSLAHALEHYALGRARHAIQALAELAPPTARVLRDGREIDVPVEQVTVGQVVLVRPGERIPTDGTVRSGRSAVDQAPITGESVPVEKEAGNEVFAGTINGDGAIEVQTTRAAGDRTLDRVVQLVEEAQTQKAPTQRFTDRFERIFVPVVLVADVLLIVVPPLLGFLDWRESFYRGMTLLVAASPCALALGTPSAVLAGIAQAARKGVLIKGGEYLENLGRVRAMALDKTGTLTVGKPDVTDLVPVDGVSERELLTVAAAVERRSQHPLAQAVVRRADAEGLALPEAGELQSLTARGVRSSLDGETVEIGSLRLWEQEGEAIPAAVRSTVEKLQASGRSVMVVRQGRRWLGVLGLADQPRADVPAILERLRRLGIKPLVMLTGDNSRVGEAIGRDVGVDEVRADLLPADKVTAIESLRKQYGLVAMVGDGVNDAPALANATVGIAMGGAGTAVALETADVALMADDLSKLSFAVGLSRQARRIIQQNLFIALGVVIILIVASTTGIFGIGPAVLAHEGSTLVVIANALRLLIFQGDE